MLRMMLICGHCGKQSLSSDDGDGIFVVDFQRAVLSFTCMKCRKENIMNLGDIEKFLKQKSGLPSIGKSNY